MERTDMMDAQHAVGAGETQGARRASGVSPARAASASKAARPIRKYRQKPSVDSSRAEYKRASCVRPTAASAPGEIGRCCGARACTRSHLITWRRQRERGELAGLSAQAARTQGESGESACKTCRRARARQAAPGAQARAGRAALGHPKKGFAAAGDPAQEPRRRRERLMQAVEQLAPASGTAPTCAALGVARATLYRQPPPSRSRARHGPGRAQQPTRARAPRSAKRCWHPAQ